MLTRYTRDNDCVALTHNSTIVQLVTEQINENTEAQTLSTICQCCEQEIRIVVLEYWQSGGESLSELATTADYAYTIINFW